MSAHTSMLQVLHICNCRKAEAKLAALYGAIEIPMGLAHSINKLWPTLTELAPLVNIQCKSDVQVRSSSYICIRLNHM